MSIKKILLGASLPSIIVAGLMAWTPNVANAQEVTLKLHNFLSPKAIGNRLFMKPWAKKLEAESKGRIKVQVFPSMQLGGKPKDLIPQARDGVVDLAWSLPGYTSGQFPLTAVFELPFVGGTASAVSPAVMEYYGKYLKEEYKDVQVIVLHSTDVGIVHAQKPINRLEDLKGIKFRAASRWVGESIKALGGIPVGMPLPRLAEALTRNQVNGMFITWSITRPYKLSKLTNHHTEMHLYNSPFAMVMNKKKYHSLPADLRKIIDANSGLELSKSLGKMWDDDAVRGRNVAVKLGNKITSLSPAEEARWVKASQPAIDAWIKVANSKGKNGAQAFADAKMLVKKYSK
jgi:TRAP-type transport system periplasmic protein